MHDAIAAANKRLEAAFASGSGVSMATLYTSNAKLLPSNSDVVQGTEDIGNFWQAVMDMGIATLTLETVELEGNEDTAIDEGRYTLGAADGSVLDQGKYIVVWKNDDGAWKLHKDIWNTSQPAE